MKTSINKLLMVLPASALVLLTAAGCNEERVSYDGPQYIMFSDTLYTLPVQNDVEMFDIPVVSMYADDNDRTLAVEIIDKESNAVEGRHYELESNTVVIKAGERVANVRVRGLYDNFNPTDSLGFVLRLICPKELQSPLYGDEAKVVLQKCKPLDIKDFTGYCHIARCTFFDSYMPNVTQRLIKTELDQKDSNTVILKNFIYDGHDLKMKFHNDDLLEPAISCDEQVFASTGEAFGTIYGDGDILITSPVTYPSYYNSFEKFVLLYMTLRVDGVGTVGTFGAIMRWISEDEAAALKKQGL